MAHILIILATVLWRPLVFFPAPADVALFDGAARREGTGRAHDRNTLCARGTSLLALLETKTKSADWREWSLAEALSHCIRNPEEDTDWRFAVGFHRGRIAQQDDGIVRITFDQDAMKEAKRLDLQIPERPIVLGEAATPVLIDILAESVAPPEALVPREAPPFRRALSILAHIADPRSAEPLLYFSRGCSESTDIVVGALLKIGGPAVPVLHEAVRQGDRNEGTPADIRHAVRRAAIAGRVLGQIGDEMSADLLIKMLDEPIAPSLIPIFCEAISQLRPDGAADAIFAQLAHRRWDGRATWRDGEGGGSPSDYGKLRTALIRLGDDARPVLQKFAGPEHSITERAIATGLNYELDHADGLQLYYEHVGRSVFRCDSQSFGKETITDYATEGREALWEKIYYRGRLWPHHYAEMPPELRIESAAVWCDADSVAHLDTVADYPLARPMLAEMTRKSMLMPDSACGSWRITLLALARLDPEEALKVCREWASGNPPDPGFSIYDVGLLMQVLIILGDPRGATLLQQVMDDVQPAWELNKSRELIETLASAKSLQVALTGGQDGLAALLDSADPDLRLSVARVLARRGDLRSVPLLFEVAAGEWAEGARPRSYAGAMPESDEGLALDALIAMGQIASPAILDASATSRTAHADLLAEAICLRITRPELGYEFDELARCGVGPISRTGRVSLDQIRSAGNRMARELGIEAVPLLEAAIVEKSGSVHPSIPAFALAEFKLERSRKIIVEYRDRISQARSNDDAYSALLSMFEPAATEPENAAP